MLFGLMEMSLMVINHRLVSHSRLCVVAVAWQGPLSSKNHSPGVIVYSIDNLEKSNKPKQTSTKHYKLQKTVDNYAQAIDSFIKTFNAPHKT